MAKNMHPCGRRILVKLDEVLDKTPGGIIIPNAAKGVPNTGVIVEIGPEVVHLKKGQQVLFAGAAGQAFKKDDDDDTTYKIMPEENVLAVLSDD